MHLIFVLSGKSITFACAYMIANVGNFSGCGAVGSCVYFGQFFLAGVPQQVMVFDRPVQFCCIKSKQNTHETLLVCKNIIEGGRKRV
jgi:hypothetical protein